MHNLPEVFVSGDKEEMSEFVLEEWKGVFQETLGRRERFALALSEGICSFC
jgi:hypothetical protein